MVVQLHGFVVLLGYESVVKKDVTEKLQEGSPQYQTIMETKTLKIAVSPRGSDFS